MLSGILTSARSYAISLPHAQPAYPYISQTFPLPPAGNHQADPGRTDPYAQHTEAYQLLSYKMNSPQTPTGFDQTESSHYYKTENCPYQKSAPLRLTNALPDHFFPHPITDCLPDNRLIIRNTVRHFMIPDQFFVLFTCNWLKITGRMLA